MKIEGVIFDLDGTLVDTEPIWRQAKKEIFKQQGVLITEEDCVKTAGLPSLETVNHWYSRIVKPTKDVASLVNDINKHVIVLMKEQCELRPGTHDVLKFWESKRLPVGLASASSMEHIGEILDRFNLNKYFQLVYSGDFERFGKPHPGIYISACKKLKINPVCSVAFEDSMVGLLSAKSAQMKAVVLLDSDQIHSTKFDFADMKIESLINFGPAEFKYLESII